MKTRKASIKETGEELSQADWARFDAAVARIKADRRTTKGHKVSRIADAAIERRAASAPPR